MLLKNLPTFFFWFKDTTFPTTFSFLLSFLPSFLPPSLPFWIKNQIYPDWTFSLNRNKSNYFQAFFPQQGETFYLFLFTNFKMFCPLWPSGGSGSKTVKLYRLFHLMVLMGRILWLSLPFPTNASLFPRSSIHSGFSMKVSSPLLFFPRLVF